jgi:hypothetical protein
MALKHKSLCPYYIFGMGTIDFSSVLSTNHRGALFYLLCTDWYNKYMAGGAGSDDDEMLWWILLDNCIFGCPHCRYWIFLILLRFIEGLRLCRNGQYWPLISDHNQNK